MMGNHVLHEHRIISCVASVCDFYRLLCRQLLHALSWGSGQDDGSGLSNRC